jgi:hypothetical protein
MQIENGSSENGVEATVSENPMDDEEFRWMDDEGWIDDE